MNNKKSKRQMGRNMIPIATFGAIGMLIGSLNAAVVNITEGSTTGYTMTEGNTYIVQNSVSFLNTTVGGSGMSVEDGATVVLYVPEGVTLTAIGANGSGRTGGGAGIRVPATSTIVVVGGGIVDAVGGIAGKGEDGQNGNNGSGVSSGYGGKGGAGGVGGGGAGAAIGGIGGLGGGSGEGGGGRSGADGPGTNGGAGGNGDVSGAMGNIYILGCISTRLRGGESGGMGSAGVSGARKIVQLAYGKDFAGGGGGGGGGGAGTAPKSPIGAGGQSGGGGGGGGGGGLDSLLAYYPDYDLNPQGGGGAGGKSNVAAGESGSVNEYYGGEGGSGGEAGAEGGAGNLYVSSTAVVDVERIKLGT